MQEPIISIHSMMDKHTFSNFSKFNNFRLNHRWLLLILFPAIMSVFAYFNLLTNSTFLFWLFIVLGFTLPLGYMAVFYVSLKNQISIYKLTSPKHVYSVHLSQNGIQVINNNEKILYKWNQVYRVYRVNNYFYLYITKARAFILPNTNIESATPEDTWKLIQEYVPMNRLKQYKTNF
jgi:hypothetical protein